MLRKLWPQGRATMPAEMPTEPRPPLTEEERNAAARSLGPAIWGIDDPDERAGLVDERAYRRRAEAERDALAARVAELERCLGEARASLTYCSILPTVDQCHEMARSGIDLSKPEPPTRTPGEPDR